MIHPKEGALLNQPLGVNHHVSHQFLIVELFIACVLVQNVQLVVQSAQNEAVVELANNIHLSETRLIITTQKKAHFLKNACQFLFRRCLRGNRVSREI